ncbi:hypothetical protein M011DRAFT_482741 [Sporormia fimetaria CBS 119925]|uniref:Uncharacterized protein n=1 Tax=Sporormia fimetaria CBS 119925 TaxID=1340428 RepID=A0A6A6VRS1_9PLEO|nr:hypothetical protein M011DRAFT_482741 [Sporormia fimetaria CBS 119925]
MATRNTVPLILSSGADNAQVTERYTLRENDINFPAVWEGIRSLGQHEGRGKRDIFVDDQGCPITVLKPCTHEFLGRFWDYWARVLDYLADFHAHDSTKMQTLWYRLIDDLQAVAKGLPHDPYDRRLSSCDHSVDFLVNYEATIRLINRLLTNKSRNTAEKMVHGMNSLAPRSKTSSTGPFKTGLKPWAQFFMKGSPGFGLNNSERGYMERELEVPEEVDETLVPMGGVEILRHHIEDLREQSEDQADDLGVPRSVATADLDANGLRFDRPHRYTSMTGHSILTQPMAPPNFARDAPFRKPFFDDRDVTDMKQKIPEFWELDDVITSMRDFPDRMHPGGVEKFHMWSVKTSGKAKQFEAGEQEKTERPFGGRQLAATGVERSKKEVLSKPTLGDMFDDWSCGSPFRDLE